METKKVTKISTILVLLILVISIFSMTLLMTYAQEERIIKEYDTYAYIIATPNPVGVNQQTYIQFRIDKVSPTTRGEEGGDHFTGFTVEISKPDGSTEVLGPFATDSTSGSWTLFTPTMVGTYTLQTKFPGQWINGTGGITSDWDRWFKPSVSQVISLTVQEDPIGAMEDIPLPTGYWERPVSAENKGWWQIMDNWLMPSYSTTSNSFHWRSVYAPYTSGPTSAHVLWTRPYRIGGIVGGKYGDQSYYTGLSYEATLRDKIIINGRLIYTEKTHGSDSYGAYGGAGLDFGLLGAAVVDLYTGEEIMYLNNTIISFGQTVVIDTANQHGITPHLWQAIPGGYKVYDAFHCVYMFSINDVPSGTTVMGPKGEVLVYSLRNGVLSMWNSTKAVLTVTEPRWGVTVRHEYYNVPIGAQVNGSLGVEWSVTVPDIGFSPSINIVNIDENVILASRTDSSVFPRVVSEVAYPALLTKDSTGNYPTSINHLWTATHADNHGDQISRGRTNIDGGVYADWDEGRAVLIGYSATTGQKLWETDPIYSEGLITFSHNYRVAYGMVYLSGYDGHVRAFNATTGDLEWDYYKGSAGFENAFGTWPDYGGFTVADGKIYVSSDDHSPESILWRGASLWCIDAFTGDEIFKLPGMLRQPAVADGILISGNSYDGLIYAVGKGPSEITVTAPDTGIPLGSSVMIKGTVLDMSPGSLGTPAIADEFMGEWMGYIHQQKSRPVDAIGVPVKIQVVDPDGTYAWIGTATSDSYGNYAYSFIPQMKGTYTIIATFDGSNSYGGSTSTTYLTVDPAPTYPTYPGYQGPSASDVAQNVVNSLPDNPTTEQISQAVINAMPEYPEQQELTIPEYTTIDIVLVILVAVAIILCVILLLRKK